MTNFSKDFFAGNRQRLRTLFPGTAPIVITANGLLQRSGDTAFPFRQDSNFWYLTGIADQDVVLVMDKDKDYVIVPENSDYQDIFEGKVDAERIKQTSGVAAVYSHKEGWQRLSGRLKKVKYVATIPAPPAFVPVYGFYTNPARAVLIARMQESNPELELLDIVPHLKTMRMIKQPPELAAIERATAVTIDSLEKIRIGTFTHEYEIEALLNAGFRATGADGHAFDPIVASGERACVIHHVANNGQIGAKDLVLLDVGAVVNGYNADLARTYAYHKPTKRQRAVYDAVLAAQDYAFSLVKPGATIRDNEQLVETFIGEKLRTLGLIKTIERDSVRKYYPHAVSHHLGLDAHDFADYDKPLEPGMVITVEPGIYVPEEGIGVRIEDEVLVTESGMSVLSERLPRDLC